VILQLIDGQVHVKLEILGKWYLVPLCDNGCAYSAMIVKCFWHLSVVFSHWSYSPDAVPTSKKKLSWCQGNQE